GCSDSDGDFTRRRESGRGSAKEDYFAEKRNSRRQRRVGRALSEVLRRRAAPTWNRYGSGRTATSALICRIGNSQNSVFEWGTAYPCVLWKCVQSIVMAGVTGRSHLRDCGSYSFHAGCGRA